MKTNDCIDNAFSRGFVPLLSIKPNRKYFTREPWITPGLLVSSKTKAKVYTRLTLISITN